MNDEQFKEHVSPAAAEHIKQWLADSKFAEYKAELEQLIREGKWEILEDSFFKVVPFGTGGRRGTVGIGSNRINRVTLGESAQSVAEYLLSLGEETQQRGIVIAYDTRLTSVEFSQFVAGVFAANGFKTYLFESFRTTPELSFAVRHLKAVAGIVISASHNPPSDNGFKVYWADGGQIVPPHDGKLMEIAANISDIKRMNYEEAVTAGTIMVVGSDVDEAYVQAVVNESLVSSHSATIVYSPLHGTGSRSVLPVLEKAGFQNVTVVEEQRDADGHFPNIANNIPNPEVVATNELATQLAQQTNADFALTTDPDADRLGVIARDGGGQYQFLTGNQIATLIGYYVLQQMQERKELTPKHFLVKTIVTTDFLSAMAEDFGVTIYDNILIGFKYVAELIRLKQDQGDETFLFGGEESHGILKGSYTRDKDAAVAALLISEQASVLKDQDKNLVWQLNELYRRYGLFWERLENIIYPGAEGFTKMMGIMKSLRENPPKEIGGETVTRVIDRLDSANGMVGDVLIYHVSEDGRSRLTVRPSGTEPKLKVYTQLHESLDSNISDQELAQHKATIDARAQTLTKKLIDEFGNS